MFTYSMHCVLIILALFSCDSADLLPTSDVIKMLEEFNITDNATALPSTVYGRSISKQLIKIGVYPQHVTWFDANATCMAEGYGSLVNGNNNIRKSIAFSSILLAQENFINFDYWSGYVRLDSCNATWSKSNCDPVRNRGIVSKIVTADQKQCATLKYNGSKVLGEHTGRFCSELHPFMCKKDLGDDMFTKLNGSLVPTSLSDLHGGNLNVSFSASTDVPQCMARCQRNERCTAFTFRYDKNRCWLQTSEAPEVVYQLFQVDVNVSSYVKDGYAYDINGNSTIQNALQVFRCSNDRTYNYTRTSPYEMNCSESTENGISVESEVATVSSGSYSSQTSTELSSSSSQTFPNHYSSVPTSTNSGPTSVSKQSTTSTGSSSRLQTRLTFSAPRQSTTSLTFPEPHALCKCPCSSFYEIQSLNQATTSTDIEEEIRRSEVPKRKTGKFQRQLRSATDDRPSSVQIGAVSIAVIVCVFGSVIVFDILKLFKHFFRTIDDP